MDPNFLTPISGDQKYRALMYGAEYETFTDSNGHVHGHHDFDVCTICSVSFLVIAMQSTWFLFLLHTQYTCFDAALITKPISGSSANNNGLVFYFVEGRCGSLPCPPYDSTGKLLCAVCTKSTT